VEKESLFVHAPLYGALLGFEHTGLMSSNDAVDCVVFEIGNFAGSVLLFVVLFLQLDRSPLNGFRLESIIRRSKVWISVK